MAWRFLPLGKRLAGATAFLSGCLVAFRQESPVGSSVGGFSAGQQSTPIGFGALGGLIAGALRTASASTKGLSGFAVYYNNEVESTGGFIAAASPDIVEEVFSVMPEDKIIPIPGAP